VRDATYRIVTERLLLRCYDPTDAPILKAAIDGSLEHLRDSARHPRDTQRGV
jgi:hypothetical protein